MTDQLKPPMSERERLIQQLMKICTIDGKSTIQELADFIINNRKQIVSKILEYVEHESSCICSQGRAGRPTTDGGYETLYGYGNKERWYKRGEEPECSCGLNETIKRSGG